MDAATTHGWWRRSGHYFLTWHGFGSCFVFQTLGDKDHMTHDKLHIMVALPPHAAISCDTWFEFVMVCGKLKFSLQSKNVKEFLPVWI